MTSALGPAGRSVGPGGPGAKVAGKLPLTRHLLDVADEVAVGGAMATSFLAAQGYRVGRSRRDGDAQPRRPVPKVPPIQAG
jgi:phosphoglycerate kinase